MGCTVSLSREARVFLEATHPNLARRFMAKAGAPSRHVANPERTTNLPKVEVSELPGSQTKTKGGFQRDFAGLKPNQVARHKPAADKGANERTPMAEGPVEFQVGSRAHKMGQPASPTGSAARFVRAAALKRR
jgi:hypothetical protein